MVFGQKETFMCDGKVASTVKIKIFSVQQTKKKGLKTFQAIINIINNKSDGDNSNSNLKPEHISLLKYVHVLLIISFR